MQGRPTVVCLCGSVRFLEAVDQASLRETLAGRIDLSVGSHRQQDEDALAHLSNAERAAAIDHLAALHRHKIDLADEILVTNVGGTPGPPPGQKPPTPENTANPAAGRTPRGLNAGTV